MDNSGLLLLGLVMLVGLAGIVIPILPGLIMVWGAVVVWALVEQTSIAWVVLTTSTLLAAVSQAVKFLVPHRRLREAGVPGRAVLVGLGLGIVGFFVIPVVGVFVGFVLGVYLHERARLGSHTGAWASSIHALKATGLSILIELLAGLTIAAGWVAAVVYSA